MPEVTESKKRTRKRKPVNLADDARKMHAVTVGHMKMADRALREGLMTGDEHGYYIEWQTRYRDWLARFASEGERPYPLIAKPAPREGRSMTDLNMVIIQMLFPPSNFPRFSDYPDRGLRLGLAGRGQVGVAALDS